MFTLKGEKIKHLNDAPQGTLLTEDEEKELTPNEMEQYQEYVKWVRKPKRV